MLTAPKIATASFAVVASVIAPAAAPDRPAEYRITAETDAGVGGMGGMAAMMGVGGPSHRLALQLASPTGAAAPQADHLVPAGLDLGRSVPLVSPERSRTIADGAAAAGAFNPEKSPKLRIYWGCGETPAAGAPRTLDGAAIVRQRGFGGLDVRFMRELSAATSAGYGEWPNARLAREVKPRASLVGDHVVQANYAPTMRFALGAERDFLAPLKPTHAKNASGSATVSWPGVARSRAYFLAVMGQAKDGAAVIWTSSAVPLSVFSIAGYLDPAEMDRLLAARALLPGDARQCTVPAAVMREIETPVLQMNALGEQGNIAEPRPAGAPSTWRPAWTVKLRYRSDAMLMLGQPAASTEPEAGTEREAAADAPKPRKRRGGLLGAAAGSLRGL